MKTLRQHIMAFFGGRGMLPSTELMGQVSSEHPEENLYQT